MRGKRAACVCRALPLEVKNLLSRRFFGKAAKTPAKSEGISKAGERQLAGLNAPPYLAFRWAVINERG